MIGIMCICGLIMSYVGHRVQGLRCDKFHVMRQRNIKQSGMVSVRVRSLIECTVLCLSDNDCYSGVFSYDGKVCQMTNQRYPSMVYSNDSLVFASCIGEFYCFNP